MPHGVVQLKVKIYLFANELGQMRGGEFDCVGNLIVKSVQTLVCAGIHQMTEVAAYYRWQKTDSHLHDRALENWLAGEDEVYSLLEQQAK
jgi:hypothetical protein